MSPAKLLADLRNAGVILQLRGDRIAIEAPAGVITAQMLERLAQEKSELVSLLRTASEPQVNPLAIEAVRELAKLLAVAYGRYSKVQRVHTAGTPASPSRGLALSGVSSVHGDGQPYAD